MAAADREADPATREFDQLKDKLARRQAMEAQIAEARKQAELHAALANELRADRFIRYVLAESMRQLAVLASTELLNISDQSATA